VWVLNIVVPLCADQVWVLNIVVPLCADQVWVLNIVPLCADQVWVLNTTDDLLKHPEQVTWTVCTMTANFAICFLGWWRCFANNYLHWAAGTTWLLLIAQGTVSFPSPSQPLSVHILFFLLTCVFLFSFIPLCYFPILFVHSLVLFCVMSFFHFCFLSWPQIRRPGFDSCHYQKKKV
jgi:hypothetical protein